MLGHEMRTGHNPYMKIRWVYIFLDTPRADAARSWAFWSRPQGRPCHRRGEDGQFATLLPRAGLAPGAGAGRAPACTLDVDTDDRAGFVARDGA